MQNAATQFKLGSPRECWRKRWQRSPSQPEDFHPRLWSNSWWLVWNWKSAPQGRSCTGSQAPDAAVAEVDTPLDQNHCFPNPYHLLEIWVVAQYCSRKQLVSAETAGHWCSHRVQPHRPVAASSNPVPWFDRKVSASSPFPLANETNQNPNPS